MILAADIGGTKIAAAVIDDAGEIVGAIRTAPTPAREGAAAVLEVACALLSEVAVGQTASAVGLSCAGVVVDGRITAATSHIAGWAGTSVASAVGSELGLPVAALNDGHAFGVGEALHGVGRGYDTVLLAAVGTGIGGAVVHRGEPWLGARGVAGHVGHVAVAEAGLPEIFRTRLLVFFRLLLVIPGEMRGPRWESCTPDPSGACVDYRTIRSTGQ